MNNSVNLQLTQLTKTCVRRISVLQRRFSALSVAGKGVSILMYSSERAR